MNPKTVQKLREETPEFKELIGYLAKKASEINTLEGLGDVPMGELAFKAAVRIGVYERIMDILEPLLKDNSHIDLPDPGEYVL